MKGGANINQPAKMKTVSDSATAFDAQGYIQNHGVTVIDHGDTISIGACEYPKGELEIADGQITVIASGAYVTF